jgi:predicted GNAT family acetyltransferase
MDSAEIDIQHRSGETKGEFYLEEDGSAKAKITYSKLGSKQIIIDHTEVSDELRGEDVGRKLVEHAVGYARKNELKVIPLCPFAKSIIQRDESLQDVLK